MSYFHIYIMDYHKCFYFAFFASLRDFEPFWESVRPKDIQYKDMS